MHRFCIEQVLQNWSARPIGTQHLLHLAVNNGWLKSSFNAATLKAKMFWEWLLRCVLLSNKISVSFFSPFKISWSQRRKYLTRKTITLMSTWAFKCPSMLQGKKTKEKPTEEKGFPGTLRWMWKEKAAWAIPLKSLLCNREQLHSHLREAFWSLTSLYVDLGKSASLNVHLKISGF